MIAGFTGTQRGMTTRQFDELVRLFKHHNITELHHGDCIGADATAHECAEALGLVIVIHPPISPVKRAFKKSRIINDPKDYLVRNRDIVDASDILFATPNTEEEKLRSGTWSTVRYARKQGKPIEIILP